MSLFSVFTLRVWAAGLLLVTGSEPVEKTPPAFVSHTAHVGASGKVGTNLPVQSTESGSLMRRQTVPEAPAAPKAAAGTSVADVTQEHNSGYQDLEARFAKAVEHREAEDPGLNATLHRRDQAGNRQSLSPRHDGRHGGTVSSALQARIAQHHHNAEDSGMMEHSLQKKYVMKDGWGQSCAKCEDGDDEKEEKEDSLAKLSSKARRDDGDNTDQQHDCLYEAELAGFEVKDWFECKEDGSQEDGKKAASLSKKVFTDAENTCDLFKLLIYCRNENKCLTSDIKEACKEDKKDFEEHFDEECDVDCSRAVRGSVGAALLMSLFVAAFVQQ